MLNDNTALGIVLKDIRENTDPNLYPGLLRKLVAALRPGRFSVPAERLQYLNSRMEQERPLQNAIQQMLAAVLNQRDCRSMFTRVGILSSGGLVPELYRQLKHRILPPLSDKRSLEYLVQQVFSRKSDYRWVQQIPDEVWADFFRQLHFDLYQSEARLGEYLCNALVTLAYRVSSLGLEEDINRALEHDADTGSPFIEQNHWSLRLVYAFRAGDAEKVNQRAAQVMHHLDHCEKVLDEIRAGSVRYGTSLEQSYLLERTAQQIQRMRYLIALLRTGDDAEEELRTTVRFFKELVEAENRRNSMRDVFQKNTRLLAYQIAEHKGNTGEHYITTTRKEYIRFLYAAMGGGAIISFIAMFKTLLHYFHNAPFWTYFWYGCNYAFGFVLLQVTHTLLATKQPAMTASTLAAYLDERKQKQPSLRNAVYAFVLVWRSQTASFIGNLAIVFPLSWLLAWGWELMTGHKLVEGKEAAVYLDDQNPLRSLAWLYACFTGIFLFLSGIISGYVDNKVRFSNVAGRIREHPLLRRILNGHRRDALARYIDHNLGGFAGNICLGFFLAFAPLLGKTFGLPFDIRHITISTASFGFGLYGLDNQVPLPELITVIIGVLGIGFFNFLSSFSLAFAVAIRSRNVQFRDYGTIIKLILLYFLRRPFDFIWPPRREQDPDHVLRDKKRRSEAEE